MSGLEVLASAGETVGARSRVIVPGGQVGADPELVGAKAASLIGLRRDGLPVPAFLCVTTPVFDEAFVRLPASLREALSELPEGHDELAGLAEHVRTELHRNGLPERDQTLLREHGKALFGSRALLSVRSSAVGEDSSEHSFAGQFDTFLCVTSELLVARVLDCFASACSPRALFYRRLRGLGLEATRMGVVVQRMVQSRAAGVAFTADPTSGRSDRVTITAGLGLGSGIVDGRVPADTFVLDAAGAIVERRIERKDSSVTHDRTRGHGTVLDAREGAEAERPALTDAQAQEIGRVARDLARRRGRPQDLEWALDEAGELVVLQCRPITTPSAGREQTFDNSNLVESYPGLTLPLTFSLMRSAYRLNFLGLMRTFGAPRKLVTANADVFENLVGLLDGRMYYNLSNWYRMFLQVPGVERALPAFEKAMGFTPSGPAERATPTVRERLRWLPLQLRILTRLIAAWVMLAPRVRAYETAFAELDARLAGEDLGALDAHQLLDRVEECCRVLFWKMAAAPTTDFFTQQLYGVLGLLIQRWNVGEPVSLRNELLCGETGMKSVEPVHSLVRLAEKIGAEDRARRLFESGASPAAVWTELQSDPSLAELNAALRRHVELYGDRSLGELKLETVTLAQDPTDLVTILRNYLRGGRNVAAMQDREQAIRGAAEQRVRSRLRRHPLRRALFAFVLARCRWGLKARESVRFTRGQMAGLFRRLYSEIGERFAEQGLLEEQCDLHYLTVSEVADAIRGAAVTRDLRSLAGLRRAEYQQAQARPAPSRIVTRGIALAGASDSGPELSSPAECGLVGVGCSPGSVRARALLVRAPSTEMALDGEILVAETTDPGWVFLMVAAGGLISERGNVLSHTAIIGRELGIPTVVGVRDAMRLVPQGAMVQLDGRAGTVTVEREAG